jgi:DNA-binding SARP family transcriptional activator
MTQPDHTTANSTGARRATIAGGLAAAGLLLVLVLAPPAALLVAVGNPMPEQAVINGRLTDSAVIGMLAVVVWVAWAQLMLAVIVEAIAAVRQAPLPRRIPFTGPQQHLARHLVIASSFLLAGGAALSVPTAAASPATAAVASCPPAADHPDLTNNHKLAPTSARPVGSGSQHGGPGVRASAIPAQARVPAVEVPSTDRVGRWYTVKPPRGAHHDTLWDIAERHLGDGLRWKEIYDLNRDRPQPDGRRLTTPSLIHPGWRLQLPADAVGLNPDNTAPHTGAKNERPRTPAAEAPDPSAAPTPTREPGPPALSTAVATADTAGLVAPPSRSESGGSIPAAAADASAAHDDDGVGAPLGAFTLGLSGLACTGLIAELARRRRRAQRFRRPGERLRRPASATERLERHLHAANAELTVTALRAALHTLADHYHRTARPLPDLQMIHLAPNGATLHFGGDEPDAPAPFAAAGPRTWMLPPGPESTPTDPAASEATARELDDPVEPYPALVALGVTDGSMVLVNLEAVGTLRISGPAEVAERIVWALALEVGTSELCRNTELALAGCPPELLRVLDGGRARVTDPTRGLRWLESRRRDVGSLLDGASARSMLDARARQILSDTWAPALLVEFVSPTDAPPADQIVIGPHRGACLITNRAAAPDTSAGWTMVEANGAWRLDPPGIGIEPQQFDLARLSQIDDLVTVEVDEGSVLQASSIEASADDGQPVVLLGPQGRGTSPAREAASELPAPRVSTSLEQIVDTSFEPAAVDCDDAEATVVGPRVLVLGPVEITGAGDDVQPGRRRRASELITYLALRPGASQHQLDEALWPGQRVSRGTRNPLVSRARQWLGSAPDGEPYVAMIGDGQEYRLHPEVTCDWDDFRALATRGLAAGSNGLSDLEAALRLVRGRPFLGVNPAAYGWAEADTQDMISAVVDVARTLAEHALAAGEYRRARWAAARGIAVEPCAEPLYRDAIRAARALGDLDDAANLLTGIRRQLEDLDPADGIDQATAALMT